MGAVKLECTIPQDLKEKLHATVGVGDRSTFVATAIREKLQELERQRMEEALEIAYREMDEEHSVMTKVAYEAQSRVAMRGK